MIPDHNYFKIAIQIVAAGQHRVEVGLLRGCERRFQKVTRPVERGVDPGDAISGAVDDSIAETRFIGHKSVRP